MEALQSNLAASGSLIGIIVLVGLALAKRCIDAFTAGGEAYAKRKGENLATKEDFNVLLDQIKKTTQATEEIRFELGHRDWSSREWKAARARKLEEMLLLIEDVSRWHDELWKITISGNFGGPERADPSEHVLVIQTMYFPELEPDVRNYLGLWAVVRSDLYGLQGANAGLELKQKLENAAEVNPLLGRQVEKVYAAQRVIRTRVTGVMRDIFGDHVGALDGGVKGPTAP